MSLLLVNFERDLLKLLTKTTLASPLVLWCWCSTPAPWLSCQNLPELSPLALESPSADHSSSSFNWTHFRIRKIHHSWPPQWWPLPPILLSSQTHCMYFHPLQLVPEYDFSCLEWKSDNQQDQHNSPHYCKAQSRRSCKRQYLGARFLREERLPVIFSTARHDCKISVKFALLYKFASIKPGEYYMNLLHCVRHPVQPARELIRVYWMVARLEPCYIHQPVSCHMNRAKSTLAKKRPLCKVCSIAWFVAPINVALHARTDLKQLRCKPIVKKRWCQENLSTRACSGPRRAGSPFRIWGSLSLATSTKSSIGWQKKMITFHIKVVTTK